MTFNIIVLYGDLECLERWCLIIIITIIIITATIFTARSNQRWWTHPQPKTYHHISPPRHSSSLPPTHFLSLFHSLYSSLALLGKSKSCVTIATAAVCENYLNPPPPTTQPSRFPPCVPCDIQWRLFWCGGNTQSSGGRRAALGEGVVEKKVRSVRGGGVMGEQQSGAAEQKEERGGIKGANAWWPDRSQWKRERKKGAKRTDCGSNLEKHTNIQGQTIKGMFEWINKVFIYFKNEPSWNFFFAWG